MEIERDFKGIWIPKEIWLSRALNLQEKVFLVEIDSLDNEEGCFASNAYFAEFFQLSKNRCSEIIKSLEIKNLITISYIREKGKKSIEKRVIKVVDKSNRGTRETDRPIRKTDKGYSEKGEDNNISLNNINNIPYQEIVSYLNEKAETKYRYTTKATQEKIKARWNEKFTLDDFKTVIDNKVADWKGKFDKEGKALGNYLRPETLFGTKFESYLNQRVAVRPKDIIIKSQNEFDFGGL